MSNPINKNMLKKDEIVLNITTPAVVFEPMSVVNIANTIIKCGYCFRHQKNLRLLCFTHGWNYRKWVALFVSKSDGWDNKKVIDPRHLLGMELVDARKLYDFLTMLIRNLKEISTPNAETQRGVLIMYNKMINDTIKVCERGVYDN